MSSFDESLDADYKVDWFSESARYVILECGRMLCDDGAHYLWGAEGEKPGEGHCKLAHRVLNSKNPRGTVFNAAVFGGCVCVGRFRHDSLKSVAPLQKVSTGSETELMDFIAKTSPISEANWNSGLTPRLISGYSDPHGAPYDYEGGGGNLVGKVVWGEGCGGTQHFDCGGFVRYCVKKTCGVSIKGISDLVKGHQPKNSFHRPMGRLLKEGERITPGDILVYDGHIAFSLSGSSLLNDSDAGPVYSKSGIYELLQAESAVYGLNYGKKRGGLSKGCIRLSRSTLLGGMA